MAVIVHDVEFACARDDRARDALGEVGTIEWKEDAQRVLLPAGSFKMEAADERAIEPDFGRALRIVHVRASHQRDAVPLLQERVAETHGMFTQATHLGSGYIFADDQYLH